MDNRIFKWIISVYFEENMITLPREKIQLEICLSPWVKHHQYYLKIFFYLKQAETFSLEKAENNKGEKEKEKRRRRKKKFNVNKNDNNNNKVFMFKWALGEVRCIMKKVSFIIKQQNKNNNNNNNSNKFSPLKSQIWQSLIDPWMK